MYKKVEKKPSPDFDNKVSLNARTHDMLRMGIKSITNYRKEHVMCVEKLQDVKRMKKTGDVT